MRIDIIIHVSGSPQRPSFACEGATPTSLSSSSPPIMKKLWNTPTGFAGRARTVLFAGEAVGSNPLDSARLHSNSEEMSIDAEDTHVE